MEGEGFGRPLNTIPGSLLQAAGGGGGLPGHARIPLHVAGAGTAAAGATRHGLEPRDCRGSDGTVPGGSSKGQANSSKGQCLCSRWE